MSDDMKMHEQPEIEEKGTAAEAVGRETTETVDDIGLSQETSDKISFFARLASDGTYVAEGLIAGPILGILLAVFVKDISLVTGLIYGTLLGLSAGKMFRKKK